MEQTFFLVFVVTLAGVLGYGLLKSERFFEYPYFMAGIFAVFALPQAVSLLRFPGEASPEAVSAALLMSCLCLGACLLGYLLPINHWIVERSSTPVNMDKLEHVAVLFILISGFFHYQISLMTDEERGGTMWSGRVTIYNFFCTLNYPGLAIALINAIQRGGLLRWGLVLMGAVIPFRSILFAGRREVTALFILTIGLTLFYQRRWVPPRLAVAGMLGFAMLAIPATGSYRMGLADQGFESVRQIDLIGNFEQFLNEESILELRNAALLIDSTRLTGDYEYGAGYWDELVFRFVPAQLVGREVKEGLMLRSTLGLFAEEMAAKGYKVTVGATSTGIGDSFQQFGFLGCLFFAVLAAVFRSLWNASLQPAAVFAQLLYIQTSTEAMRAVTHQTVGYLPGLVYHVIFLGLAVWYARDPHPPRYEEDEQVEMEGTNADPPRS